MLQVIVVIFLVPFLDETTYNYAVYPATPSRVIDIAVSLVVLPRVARINQKRKHLSHVRSWIPDAKNDVYKY